MSAALFRRAFQQPGLPGDTHMMSHTGNPEIANEAEESPRWRESNRFEDPQQGGAPCRLRMTKILTNLQS